MTNLLQGVGGAPGIALGKAFRYVLTPTTADVDASPAAALERFRAAQAAAIERLNALAEAQREQGYEAEAGIFEFQALMVEDPTLDDAVVDMVSNQGLSLDAALDAAIAQARASIAALDDEYLRERAADVDAVGMELRRALYGGPSLAKVPAGAIIVAADLTPAETVELPRHVAGFATAFGGPTGHTAILARSRGIPAVVGLGDAALEIVDGTSLILDGDAAQLLVEPTAEQTALYTQRREQQEADRLRRQSLRDVPGQLADGHAVALWANIGRPEEAALALEQGAEGIGLFRTEFLFLDRHAAPSEEEQFAAYRTTLETIAGRPVVVRTLDIGGDKEVPYLGLPHEANPFLGVRGIRLCMQQPELFTTQLRALLRAAVYGDLWVMLPMVATVEDVVWAREQLRLVAAALEAEGIAHRADVRLGAMIETPAAAVTADLLAREVAFFSVGSNDLTQYTMAADRGLAQLVARYPHDSAAVLRLIQQTAAAAKRAGILCGVCGDLAGTPAIAAALAAMGIDELSMAPALIPVVKEHLRGITFAEAQARAQALMQLDVP